jgi:microsomal dipeptidase-like Zn-dependent dipeptidase
MAGGIVAAAMGGRRILAAGAAIAAIAALALALAAPGTAAPKQSRYSLVHGCYSLQPAAGGFVQKSGDGYDTRGTAPPRSEAFRMQATDLGSYLLFGRDRDFLAVDGGSIAPAAEAGPRADWRVVPAKGSSYRLISLAANRPLARGADGRLVLAEAGRSDRATRFGFAAAGGCSVFPEVELNAKGTPARGDTAFERVVGLADMHNHVSAFEFLGGRAHCGKPWDRYGVERALTDCPDHYPDGRGAILENLFYGDPTRAHDPVGWPTFASWPAHDSLTHEQTYWRWLERAWLGGERLMVNNLVENGVLCRTYPLKKNSCDEMDAVRLQAQRMRELEDYIDAQAGGPGRGFLRIVSNPFEARRVINRGKLAVVLGIENSELFGCIERMDVPQCSFADVKRGMDEVKRLGVSSLYPVHKFDNAFGGTRFDGGAVGPVINSGQFSLSGHFWSAETCEGKRSDNTIEGATLPSSAQERADAISGSDDADVIDAGLAQHLDAAAAAPVYPPPPHCNTRGLTPLGHKLIDLMIDEHMLIEVDHMSVKARDEVMRIVRRRGYSGVLSGHEWSDPRSYREILHAGGMVGGRANDVEGFVADYEKYSKGRSKRYFFGWGHGPDANGLGALPSPSEDGNPVGYPFKGIVGDVTFQRQRSGERVFDVNEDGTAHYGLLPDWWRDLRLAAGRDSTLPRALKDGAEAYLQTWERAYGVPRERCFPRRGRLTHRGLGKLRIDAGPFSALKRVGQPKVRRDHTYRYCVKGSGRSFVGAAFLPRARLLATDGPGYSAGPVEVGDPERALRGVARERRGNFWVESGRKGRSRFVYVARKSRVVAIGLAGKGLQVGPRGARAVARIAG